MALTLAERAMGPEARFWAGANKSGECWVWRSGKFSEGYGRYQYTINGKRRNVLAHRYAYETAIGPIPEGRHLHHTCQNKACVNPAHLQVVSITEHILLPGHVGYIHKSKTHCANGHLYDDKNTRWGRKGRECRACDREKARKRRAARLVSA